MMQNNDSNKFSNENNKLLDVVKQYLRIEHQDDDKDPLDYIRGRAGLYQDKWLSYWITSTQEQTTGTVGITAW